MTTVKQRTLCQCEPDTYPHTQYGCSLDNPASTVTFENTTEWLKYMIFDASAYVVDDWTRIRGISGKVAALLSRLDNSYPMYECQVCGDKIYAEQYAEVTA